MRGGKMRSQKLGMGLFVLGVLFVHVHTTAAFLWAALGLPLRTYPLLLRGGFLSYVPGFTPAIGGLLLVIGSLIYGQQSRR
jgi:hypothetical protein